MRCTNIKLVQISGVIWAHRHSAARSVCPASFSRDALNGPSRERLFKALIDVWKHTQCVWNRLIAFYQQPPRAFTLPWQPLVNGGRNYNGQKVAQFLSIG